MRDLIKRSDKKMFYGVPSVAEGETTFTRMHYFTELSTSKNPVEYSRQYVDEAMERTDVTGYSPSISFNFDDYAGDTVLEDIVTIINEEKLGKEAQRDIILVDFSKEVDGGFVAVKRTFAVIADSEGDGTEAYTYSGNFKVSGTPIKGTAKIETPADSGNPDNVETITFAPDSVANVVSE